MYKNNYKEIEKKNYHNIENNPYMEKKLKELDEQMPRLD